MVCDFLRSCYSQNVMYDASDPTKKYKATWYFTKPGALPFPGLHSFGSPTWDWVHPFPTTIGFDASSPRSYYNGRRLNISDGNSFAGPMEYFLDGQSSASPLQRGDDGTPAACILRPAGFALGGISPAQTSLPPVRPPCISPRTMPYRLSLRLSFAKDPSFPLVGTPWTASTVLTAITPTVDPSGLVNAYWKGSITILGNVWTVYFGCDTTGLSGPMRASCYNPVHGSQFFGTGNPAPVSPWFNSSLLTFGVNFGQVVLGDVSTYMITA